MQNGLGKIPNPLTFSKVLNSLIITLANPKNLIIFLPPIFCKVSFSICYLKVIILIF